MTGQVTPRFVYFADRESTEVSLQQTFESFSVAGFVADHFMHGVIVGLRPTAGNGNARSLHWNYRLSRYEPPERLISLIL